MFKETVLFEDVIKRIIALEAPTAPQIMVKNVLVDIESIVPDLFQCKEIQSNLLEKTGFLAEVCTQFTFRIFDEIHYLKYSPFCDF